MKNYISLVAIFRCSYFWLESFFFLTIRSQNRLVAHLIQYCYLSWNTHFSWLANFDSIYVYNYINYVSSHFFFRIPEASKASRLIRFSLKAFLGIFLAWGCYKLGKYTRIASYIPYLNWITTKSVGKLDLLWYNIPRLVNI